MRLRRRRRRRPRGKLFGREAEWGVEPGALDGAREFVADLPRPGVPGVARPTTTGPRHLDERLRDGAGHVPALRRGEDPAGRRAHPPHNADIPEEIITGLAEMGALRPVGARGVRRLRRRAARATTSAWSSPPRSCRAARSASAARSSPGPRSSPGRWSKGGTEEQKQEWLPKLATAEVMAAGRRHRARLRLRRRRHQGHRHADADGDGWLHQRREDVVHVRRPGRRAHAAGPHRPRPVEDPPRACRCSSCRSRAARATASSSPQDGSAAGRWRAAPIDTIGYRGMHSYEIAFDNWFVAGRQPGRRRGRPRAGASTTRWPASRTAGCRPRPGPSA